MKTNWIFAITVVMLAVFIVGCSTKSAPPSNTNAQNVAVDNNPSVTQNQNPTSVPSSSSSNTTASDNTSSNVAAQTTPTPSTGTVKELKIEAYNFGFNVVSNVQINKGDTVKLTVTSTQGTHGFSLPDFNVDISPIGPGDSQSATFVADKSGSFEYRCNVPCGPGHRDMTGTLVVN